jgi:hypothetical protein
MLKIFSFFNKKAKADKDIDIFLKQIENQRQAAIKELEYLTKVLNENK